MRDEYLMSKGMQKCIYLNDIFSTFIELQYDTSFWVNNGL